MKKIDSKKLLLYMLFLGYDDKENIPIEGATRIQKMFFILEKEIIPYLKNKEYDAPQFFAYNFGPYSKEISDNLRFFCNIGFIEEKILNYDKPENAIQEEAYDESDWVFEELDSNKEQERIKEYSYTLTKTGIKYTKENLLSLFTNEDKKLLQEFKKKICGMQLYNIIEYVYNKYKDMTEKSLIKDKF